MLMPKTRFECLRNLQRIIESVEALLESEDLGDAEIRLLLLELDSCERYLESLLPHSAECNGGLNAIIEQIHHVN